MPACGRLRTTCSRHACSWRTSRELPAARACTAAACVDEAALESVAAAQLQQMSDRLRALGGGAQATQQVCGEYNRRMEEICAAAIAARDAAVVAMARGGNGAVRALQRQGLLDPPWLDWLERSPASAATELARALGRSLPSREYTLRARVVRAASAPQYSALRPPAQFARADVARAISAADAAALRAGEPLVIDPKPPFLPPDALRQVREELLARVRGGGALRSQNPCNTGSYHGMLPVNFTPGSTPDAPSDVSPALELLLRRIAALPALIDELATWPRPLAVPPMAQLGWYPADSDARCRDIRRDIRRDEARGAACLRRDAAGTALVHLPNLTGTVHTSTDGPTRARTSARLRSSTTSTLPSGTPS